MSGKKCVKGWLSGNSIDSGHEAASPLLNVLILQYASSLLLFWRVGGGSAGRHT